MLMVCLWNKVGSSMELQLTLPIESAFNNDKMYIIKQALSHSKAQRLTPYLAFDLQ